MNVIKEKEIYSIVNPEDIIDAIEEAYLIQHSGKFIMPNRMHLQQNGNTLLIMPAIAHGFSATKLVSLNPLNTKIGLPVIRGTVQLTEFRSGDILAILDGSTVTAIRTGAVGAVAVKWMTKKDISGIGIIGTGVQGQHLAWMIHSIRPEATIHVYDYKAESTKMFVEIVRYRCPGIKLRTSFSMEEFLSNTDAIVTATSSPDPVLPDDPKPLSGKVFIGIGSFRPGMGEFPRSVFALAGKIYVDADYAKEESGDVKYPLDKRIINDGDIIPFHRIVSGELTPSENTLIFKSVGMALFDLTVSMKLYERSAGLRLNKMS
jgi:ornithine cyclodeaminase/alanine dehydrogenase-like protein (mu-crystallin family)